MKLKYLAFVAACSAGITATPRETQAAEPFTKNKVMVTGQLGYGVSLDDVDVNGYGFGFGVRGGYTLDLGVYLGGRFDYYLGESDNVSILGSSSSIRGNFWLLQPEVGYDVGLTKSLVFRPKLGFGLMQARARACFEGFGGGETCASDSETAGSISLGAELPIAVGPVVLSPETRINVWTGDGTSTGLLFALHAGAVF